MGRMIHLTDEEFTELAETFERVSEFLDQVGPERSVRSLQARLESANECLELVALSPVLEQLAISAARLGKERGVSVEWVMPGGSSPRVPHAVRDALAEVLVHGVRNAIAHGGRDSTGDANTPLRVEFSFWMAGDLLGVSLTDSGRGPPAGLELEALFKPEKTTLNEASKCGIAGRGLGLSAVRSAVEKIQGAAWAQIPYPNREEGARGFALLAEIPVGALA
ncbi:MAG: ATP-binding protein, partial [Bdellovibrionota bacterium]